MILCKQELAKDIDRTVFPGIQGGPHLSAIAAKAVCFHEALQPEFSAYQQQVVDNAKALADGLLRGGLQLVSGGTDNHLLVVKLLERDYSGKAFARALEGAGIITSMSTVPGETRKPAVTSGVRFGTPAVTTRGATEAAHAARRADRQHGWPRTRRHSRPRRLRVEVEAIARELAPVVRPCLGVPRAVAGYLLGGSLPRAASAQSSTEVVVGEIKGIINPVMAGYVDRVISDAERSNAPAVVFYMDTPGGLSDAMRDINLRILAARCRSSSTSRPTARAPARPACTSRTRPTWWRWRRRRTSARPRRSRWTRTAARRRCRRRCATRSPTTPWPASARWPSNAAAILTSPSAPCAKAPTCRPAKP